MAETKKLEDVVAEALAELSESPAANQNSVANGNTETDEDSSDTSSTTSSSSGSSEQSTGSLSEDGAGAFYVVTCGPNEANFYLNRFARGSVGKCVFFRGEWLTPNGFQAVSGRQSSKDWKRSIRYKGRCVKELMYEGKFQEHLRECACPICMGNKESVDLRDRESVTLPQGKRRRLSVDSDQSRASSTAAPTPTPVSTQKVPMTSVAPTPVVQPSEVIVEEWKLESKPVVNNVSGSVPTRSLADHHTDGRVRRPRKAKGQAYHTSLGVFSSAPKFWSVEDVGEFLQNNGFSEYMVTFGDHEVDGKSLLLLEERHLVDNFEMKLGPTLKLLECIYRLSHPP